MQASKTIILVLASLAGCNNAPANQPKMERVANLSNVGSQNVTSVMRLINDLCIRRSASTSAMAGGLTATGWQWNQTQRSDPKQSLSLDLWKSPPVQVIRGNLAGEEITSCTISIEGPAAPESNLVANELSGLTGHSNQNAREWWWRSSPSTQTHIELMDTAFEEKPGMTVLVENYKLPWWRSILGT